MSDVAVLFGGPSPEHDVSVLTGLQAAHELARSGRHHVRTLYWAKSGSWFEVAVDLEAEAFLEGVPRPSTGLRLAMGAEGGFLTERGRLGRLQRQAIDVALVCCHGGPGEDGTLQAALDLAGIPYTGPTVAGAALGMDKLAFAGAMSSGGLPVLPRVLLTSETTDLAFEGPYVVKPRFGGSSIGIDVVTDVATAVSRLRANPHLRQGAVVEPYRKELFDLQLGVRSWPQLAASAIERPLRRAEAPVVLGAPAGGEIPGPAGGEIPGPAGGEILGYADKYVGGQGMVGAPRELPAAIAPALATLVVDTALEVARRCMLRGLARVDFLSDGELVWVNEINTIPGSLARYLWIDPPVRFDELLEDLLAEALERPSHAYSVTGADGSVLRGAASIAAKLA